MAFDPLSGESRLAMARMYKWDHVVELEDQGSVGHVMEMLQVVNAGEDNYAMRDQPGLAFDVVLDRMMQTYAMYVYCPAKGLKDVMKELRVNHQRIKRDVLARMRSSSNEGDHADVYNCMAAFVAAATEVVASKFMSGRIQPAEAAVEQLALLPAMSSDVASNLYEAVRHLGKQESFRFSRTKDGGEYGVQKNFQSDGTQADHINIDDILASNAKLRHDHYPNKETCNSADKVTLHRDDYGIACNLSGKKVSLGNFYQPAAEAQVRQRLNGPPSPAGSRNQAKDAMLQATAVHADVLYKASALLLDQARLRLSHGSEEYSMDKKLTLTGGASMSEAYLRFYDRHLTDFVKCASHDSPMHAFLLGAAVAQVQFRMLRERCDEILAETCEAYFERIRDEMKTRNRRAIFKQHKATEATTREPGGPDFAAGTSLRKYLDALSGNATNAQNKIIKIVYNKSGTDPNEPVKYARDRSNHMFTFYVKDPLKYLAAIERMEKDVDGATFACSPSVALSVVDPVDTYHRLYSDEVKMFHLTARPFVDQFIHLFGRIDRELSLVQNEFQPPDVSLYIGKDDTQEDTLKRLAGGMYNTYVEREMRAVTGTMFQASTYTTGPKANAFGKEWFTQIATLTDTDKETLRGIIDEHVDLVRLDHIPTLSSDDDGYVPPFQLTRSDSRDCPFQLSFTPCDPAAELGCYGPASDKNNQKIMAMKAFDMTAKEDALRNMANSLMLGFSAMMHTSTTIVAFGGSGVGKTSMFFGRKEDSVRGLMSYLFDCLPALYPFHNDGKREITLNVVEVVANGAEINYDNRGEPVQNSSSTRQNIPIPGGESAHVESTIKGIIEKVDAARARGKRIRETENNPVSSRSVMIYKVNVTYSGGAMVYKPGLMEDDDGAEAGAAHACSSCSADMTVSISLVDLPGYELAHMVGNGIPAEETEFINGAVKASLDWVSGRGGVPGILKSVVDGDSRVASFVVFNNSSGNKKKKLLEAVAANRRKIGDVWTVNNTIDDVLIKTLYDSDIKVVLGRVRYASQYIEANRRVARALFHKMHEDQRIMFGLMQEKFGDRC